MYKRITDKSIFKRKPKRDEWWESRVEDIALRINAYWESEECIERLENDRRK